jgi:serine/threonine protein phosphatase PrpC
MRIEVAGSSHVGMKRSHNEDRFLLLPDQALFCVADGMGGHASGEVASRLAVEELSEFFHLTAADRDVTWPYRMDPGRSYDENRLTTGIKLANRTIFERAGAEANCRGMGTTLVAAHFAADILYVGHVGDSRAYALRDGAMRQLTEDHSLLNDYLKARPLTQAQIDAFPHKNVIVRALGMRTTVQVDVVRLAPEDGDLYLLCSDGLSGMVPDAQLHEVLTGVQDLEEACRQLIERANRAGGTDNITCVLARYHAG